MDVLGEPVDEAGPVETEIRLPIHRASPEYAVRRRLLRSSRQVSR